jgi:hypothetical protein
MWWLAIELDVHGRRSTLERKVKHKHQSSTRHLGRRLDGCSIAK